MIGCTPSTKEAPDPLVVGFSQSGTESSWRKKHTESIITALEKEDYQVLYRNGYMNQERQIQDIRTFIAYKVDMIIFTPLQESGWDSVLKEAKRAGIPVILVDRHIQTNDPSFSSPTSVPVSKQKEIGRVYLSAITSQIQRNRKSES